MTQSGPEPLEMRHSHIDYKHYLTKQPLPIADAILQPLGRPPWKSQAHSKAWFERRPGE